MARRFGNESDSPAPGFELPDPLPPNLVPELQVLEGQILSGAQARAEGVQG